MLRHMLGMILLLNYCWNQIPNVSFFYDEVLFHDTIIVMAVFTPPPLIMYLYTLLQSLLGMLTFKVGHHWPLLPVLEKAQRAVS